MGHTKENSATYLIVSNFKGSMRTKAFVQYLGLDIKLSKNALLEDGTHKTFDTPSVKITSEPDMYILDDKNKILILIENKVKVDRELEESQTSEDGYLAILKDYTEQGYQTFLCYLIPQGYYYQKELEKICKKHSNVQIIDWNNFLDNFDTDDELKPVKKAIESIQIDGVELEEDDFNRPVNFGILSATIRKEQKKAELYIGYLLFDVCNGLDGKIAPLWYEGNPDRKWGHPRYDIWDSDTNYAFYEESPAIEIKIRDDTKYYIVCGYDLIKNKFCLWIKNKQNGKFCTRYNNTIQLPFGEIKSYYAIKEMLQEQIYNFIKTELDNLKNINELK